MTLYVVLVVGAAFALSETHPPTWARVVAVLGPVAAIVYAIGSQVRWVRGREGLERVLFHEGASLAFFVTVLSGLTYGFLQVWAGLPMRLSGFWVYGFGMVVWALLTMVVARRYR